PALALAGAGGRGLAVTLAREWVAPTFLEGLVPEVSRASVCGAGRAAITSPHRSMCDRILIRRLPARTAWDPSPRPPRSPGAAGCSCHSAHTPGPQHPGRSNCG